MNYEIKLKQSRDHHLRSFCCCTTLSKLNVKHLIFANCHSQKTRTVCTTPLISVWGKNGKASAPAGFFSGVGKFIGVARIWAQSTFPKKVDDLCVWLLLLMHKTLYISMGEFLHLADACWRPYGEAYNRVTFSLLTLLNLIATLRSL